MAASTSTRIARDHDEVGVVARHRRPLGARLCHHAGAILRSGAGCGFGAEQERVRVRRVRLPSPPFSRAGSSPRSCRDRRASSASA